MKKMIKKILTRLPNDLKNLSFLTSISLISNVIGLFRNLILAFVLGVNEFGYYVLYLTFASYISYLADMGFNSGALRLIPFYRGKIDNAEEDAIFSDTYGISLIQGVFWLFLFLIISFLALDNTFLSNLIILLGIHAMFTTLVNFLNLSARLNNRFFHVGISNLLISLTPLILLMLVYFLKFNIDFFIAGILNLLGLFSCLLFLLYFESIKPHFRISKKSIKRLFLSGFPLMLASTIGIFMLTAERLIVAQLISDEGFGFYAFASTFGGIVIVVGTTWSYLRTQILIESFSRENSKAEIFDKGCKDLIFLTLLFISIFPMVGIFSNLVPLFLAEYEPAVNALIYHAIAAGCLASWIIFSMINVATNRINLNILFGSFFILLKIFSFYMTSRLNFDFNELSLLNVAFNFVIIGFVCVFYVLKQIEDKGLNQRVIFIIFYQLTVISFVLSNSLFFQISMPLYVISSIVISISSLYYLYKNYPYLLGDKLNKL